MIESWNKYMNIGTIHFMSFPEVMKGEGPIVETLEKILANDFFTAVEITHIKDLKVREEAKKMLESSHVVSAYGAQPVLLSNKLNLNSLIEEERKKAVDEIKKCIEEAAFLGTKGVAVLSGLHPGKELESEAIQKLLQSLEELCEYSQRFKLKFELESFDFDVDKKCLIGKSSLAAEVAREVRKKFSNFGLILDLSHFPIQHEQTKVALRNCLEYITHLHIGNCVLKDKSHPAYGDQHPRFGINGGESDVEEVREFFASLFEIGWLNKDEPVNPEDKPIVSFEVKPMPWEKSSIILANSIRVFKTAWELL
ncbi:MAG TPA: sugar phosphate isomerase/epimerase family protein [Bacteroidales bacterium]|nr:sugar phosphate isomerase/epimerase family protein [Bacteroidales bacterium]